MNVLPVYTTDKEDSGWWNDVPAQFIFRADSVTRVRNFISCYYVIAPRLFFIVYIVTGPLSCSPSCYGTIHSAYGEIISRFCQCTISEVYWLVHPTRTRDSPTDASAARLETQFWTTVPLDYSVKKVYYSPAWLLCEEGILQSRLITLWRSYDSQCCLPLRRFRCQLWWPCRTYEFSNGTTQA